MQLNRVNRVDDQVRINTALISTADKTGLDTLVRGLLELNPKIKFLSTGGTFRAIESMLAPEQRACLQQVSEYTGQPEMQGGLVKTLDFRIYLGLLSETYNSSHAEDLERQQVMPIDLVVTNLYPFEQTVAAEDVTLEDARANIDIGGPCMVRAAAKNFLRVAVLSNPAAYADFLEVLQTNSGSTGLAYRMQLACEAFAYTARYEQAISGYLSRQSPDTLAALYSTADA